MLRRVVPIVVVLATLTACSSTIEGTPRRPGDDIPQAERGDVLALPDDETPRDRALERLLIDLDDLPPGWTRDEPDDAEDDDDTEEFGACLDAVEPPQFLRDARGGVAGEAEVDFTGPDELSSASQTLIRMDFPEDTEIYLAALAEVFGQCSSQSVDIDGRPARVEIVPAALPDVGDAARSWVMTLDVGIPLDLHFGAITAGEFVTIVVYADPLGDGRTGLVDLARVAVAKLR